MDRVERYRYSRQTAKMRQAERQDPLIREKGSKPLSRAEKRAAEIRAANSAAFSQLTSRPNFMQKSNEDPSSSKEMHHSNGKIDN